MVTRQRVSGGRKVRAPVRQRNGVIPILQVKP